MEPLLGRAIELHGLPMPGALEFDLEDVLAALPPEAASLHWRLYDFEAIPHDGNESDRARAGWEVGGPSVDVSWEELQALARGTAQTVWAHLAAARRRDDLPAHWKANVPGREMERFADLLLVAHDATFWGIWSRDAAWLDAFAESFSDVRPSDTRIGAL
jgi:hypothetical protein